MQFHEFVSKVQMHAGFKDKEEAIKAIRATLNTLGERISGPETAQLAAQLPHEMQSWLPERGEGERFGIQEFYSRVAKGEGVDGARAANHVKAVFSVLLEAVSPGEIHDIRAQLPEDYKDLFDSSKKCC